MTKRPMVLGFLLGGTTVALVWLAVNGLLDAVTRGKCKRVAADIRSIATAAEHYRRDHSGYPEALSVDVAASFLEPYYIRTMPRQGIEYFSDGTSFVVVGRGFPQECYFKIVNGEFVEWPTDWLGARSPSKRHQFAGLALGRAHAAMRVAARPCFASQAGK